MIWNFLKGKTPAYFNALLNYVAVEDVAEGHVLAAGARDAWGGIHPWW